MTLQEFINMHKVELQEAIHEMSGSYNIDYNDIELWIQNDEVLYNWACDYNVDDI